MNKQEFEKIKRIIYRDIKPIGCKIIYFKKTLYRMQSPFYLGTKRTCYIKKTDYIGTLYSILHEVCHDLTWKDQWRVPFYKGYPVQHGIAIISKKKGFIDPKDWKKYWKPLPTKYLSEYLAEKTLRKLCKHYKWDHILNKSNQWVKLFSKHVYEPDVHNYTYAAKRIYREEKL